MSTYYNTTTGEYPLHYADLEALGWPAEWVEVEVEQMPSAPSGSTCERQGPTLIDGVWKITWVVRPITDEEKQHPVNLPSQPFNLLK